MGRPFADPCPICVRWHCLTCGHWKSSEVNSRTAPLTKICDHCGSTDGEWWPVSHYNRDLHDLHVRRHALEDHVIPVDQERIRDLQALVDFLQPHMRIIDRMRRRNMITATESCENNVAVNIGNEELLKIEDVVRNWVKDHPVPEDHPPGIMQTPEEPK